MAYFCLPGIARLVPEVSFAGPGVVPGAPRRLPDMVPGPCWGLPGPCVNLSQRLPEAFFGVPKPVPEPLCKGPPTMRTLWKIEKFNVEELKCCKFENLKN